MQCAVLLVDATRKTRVGLLSHSVSMQLLRNIHCVAQWRCCMQCAVLLVAATRETQVGLMSHSAPMLTWRPITVGSHSRLRQLEARVTASSSKCTWLLLQQPSRHN
jgi:hypothetical protein